MRKPGERGAVHSDGAQEQSNFIRVDLDAEGGIQMYDVCDVRFSKKQQRHKHGVYQLLLQPQRR